MLSIVTLSASFQKDMHWFKNRIERIQVTSQQMFVFSLQTSRPFKNQIWKDNMPRTSVRTLIKLEVFIV